MITEEIRSYEVSLWTLQDDFITVLKWSDVEQKGRIEQPKMTLNIDGTQKFSFSIPMYYRVNGELVENPNWYNTQNGNLMTGLRKIKVIFNKTTDIEEVFEFLIINIKESHEKDILTCEIECEGLAFQELGKIGYNISLSQDNFELDYAKWADSGEGEEPLQTVQYWCEAAGLKPLPEDVTLRPQLTGDINPRQWYYYIDMNYQSFSDTSARDSHKVYEEPYVTAWDNNLVPIQTEDYREKCRPISIEKSNLYNITQTIAETFEIFCRYQYFYDENYHIIGHVIIFYNNFIQEDEGYFGFSYPYNLSQVTRIMDSAAVTTKMFILNPDENTDISTAEPNDSLENYILNFDYMYQTKAINQEQYDAIIPYKKKMRQLNEQLIDLQAQINSYTTQIIEDEAKQAIVHNAVDIDKEQVYQNSRLRNALDIKDAEADGLITIEGNNADYFLLSPKEDGTYYINLAYTNKGIKEDTVKIFSTMRYAEGKTLLDNQITNYQFIYDIKEGAKTLIGISLSSNIHTNVNNIDWGKLLKDRYIPEGYKGNVDLSCRKIIPASKFIEKGYSDFDGTYGTLFSESWTPCDEDGQPIAADGKYYDIVYTCITADGTVLNQEEELYPYLDEIIASGTSPQEWMAADQKRKKLLLHYEEVASLDGYHHAGDWAFDLHEMQAEWDSIRANHNWFGYDSNPDNVYIEPKSDASISGLNNYIKVEEVKKVYLTYKYNPKLYYDNIVQAWAAKQAEDEAEYKALTRKIGPKSITDTDYDMSVYPSNTTINTAYAAGMYKKLDDATQEFNNVLNTKNEAKQAFERLMGPALREGYWQPEDYHDYGERHEYSGSITNNDITADSKKQAIIAWDAELFDTEDKLYYERTVNRTKIYYPCVDLQAIYGNSIPTNLDKFSVAWIGVNQEGHNAWNTAEFQDIRQYAVGSQALIKFVQIDNVIKPVLMIKGVETFTDDELTRLTSTGSARLEIFSTSVSQSGVITVTHSNVTAIGNNWILVPDNVAASSIDIVYPRIKFSANTLKTDEDSLVIYYGTNMLKQYEDYYILTRNTKRSDKYYQEYYITIKPETLIKYGLGLQFLIKYILSNAQTEIYLDALKVSKENAWPKVSYEVSVNVLNINILRELYSYLARILMINDVGLKFENVFGYISGLELDLDNCANDKVEVKNYKTKFEDLFSTIVAQTESMKQNSAGITTALNGDIALSQDGFNETLLKHTNILNAYLDSHFDSSAVVKQKLTDLFNEAAEVLSTAKNSLNSMTALTQQNADILGGFAENVASELTTKVHYSEERPGKFDRGDIWIQTDANGNEIGRYLAIMSSSELPEEATSSTRGFVRTHDGSLASITGASLDIDAEAGIINILAQNYLNIQSGKNVYIAANEKVDIVGNKSVNIGGTEINICTLGEMTLDEDGILVPTESTQVAGSINLIAGALTSKNDSAVSKVLISPTKIEMGAAELELKAASKINLIASQGEVANTSAVSIDAERGVWIGAGAGVRLYSGTTPTTSQVYVGPVHAEQFNKGDYWVRTSQPSSGGQYEYDGYQGHTPFYTGFIISDNTTIDEFTIEGIYKASNNWSEVTGAAINNTVGWTSLNDNSRSTAKTIIKSYGSKGASIELNGEHLLLGYVNTQNNKGTAIEATEDYLILAAGKNWNTANFTSKEVTGTSSGLVGAKFTSESIGLATGSGNNINAILLNNKGVTIGSGSVDITLPTTGNNGNNLRASSGSYVRISGTDGIELGSLTNLYVNMNNFKLQTDSQYGTRFAVGQNLQNIETINTADDTSSWVGMVYNQNGLYIKGKIYASAFILGGEADIPHDQITGLDNYIVQQTTVASIVQYQISNSATTIPDTWSNTLIAATTAQPYLWTKTTITYANGTPSIAYSVAYKGTDGTNGTNGTNGTDGRYATTITPLYYLHTSSSSAPTAPSGTITNTADRAGEWTKTIPTYTGTTDSPKYYWRCTQYEWSDNSNTTWSDVVVDFGLSYAARTATSASITATAAANTVEPFTHDGLDYNVTWGGITYGVVLGSQSNALPMLIGSNSGITIAKSATSSDGAALVLNSSGIALNGTTITLQSPITGGGTNVVSLNGNGITIGSSGKLDIGTTNFVINSAATGNETMFRLGNSSTPALSYSSGGGLSVTGAVTATNFVLTGSSSGISYNDLDDKPTIPDGSNFTINGISSNYTWNGTTYTVAITSTDNLLIGANSNGYSGGITIAKDASSAAVTINNAGINFDYDASNYIHMGANGIEAKGNSIKMEDINGQLKNIWGRGDIVVMNPNASGNDAWRSSVASIESTMSANGVHDWVLIRPYYNGTLIYTGTAIIENNTYKLSASGTDATFGDNSDWYQYDLTFDSLRAPESTVPSDNVTHTIYLSTKSDFSENTIQLTCTADVHQGPTSVSVSSGQLSGNSRINLCKEDASIYIKTTNNASAVAMLNNVILTCTCSTTTSRVPCTVYYYT